MARVTAGLQHQGVSDADRDKTTLLKGLTEEFEIRYKSYNQSFIHSVEPVVDTHCTVGPAQFYLIHHPQFMDVFCKLLPDPLQVRWQHDLDTDTQKDKQCI